MPSGDPAGPAMPPPRRRAQRELLATKLPQELVQRLRVWCERQDVLIQDATQMALEEFLTARGG
jgi:hypothetical protein